MSNQITCKNSVTPTADSYCAACQKDTTFKVTYFYMDWDNDGFTTIEHICIKCGYRFKTEHTITDFEIKFTQTVKDFIVVANKERQKPTCPCCGETENLTHGNTMSLCQDAAREALSEKG